MPTKIWSKNSGNNFLIITLINNLFSNKLNWKNFQPSTGYYDAALGYQSTGPVTSLGSSRNDTLSSVQNVQSVQGQFNSISDTRFSRTDNNTSPVSTAMSAQQVNKNIFIFLT